jgi:hypothetical protein
MTKNLCAFFLSGGRLSVVPWHEKRSKSIDLDHAAVSVEATDRTFARYGLEQPHVLIEFQRSGNSTNFNPPPPRIELRLSAGDAAVLAGMLTAIAQEDGLDEAVELGRSSIGDTSAVVGDC